MAMKGMDVEAGRQASSQLTNGSQEVQQLSARMTQVIDGFDWVGPDADRTRETWKSDGVSHMAKVQEYLEQFSQLVNREAELQEAASS